MDPATATLVAAALTAAGSVGGGMLAGSSPKETKIQKTKRHLIDKLLASINGEGPYSDLFATDEAAFQKSFVDPAKAMYKNQIAPQIQQAYIATGQHRGTGMEDQLLRAGVDLDQMLNQNYMAFQNQGKDRMTNMINSILSGDSGAPAGMSSPNNFQQGVGGFLSSDSAKDLVKAGTNYFSQNPAPTQPTTQATAPRRGYEAEPNWRDVQFMQR